MAYGYTTSWENRADSKGRFAIKNVPPGALRVSAEADGWEPGPVIQVDLRSGQTVTDVKLRVGEEKQTSEKK